MELARIFRKVMRVLAWHIKSHREALVPALPGATLGSLDALTGPSMASRARLLTRSSPTRNIAQLTVICLNPTSLRYDRLRQTGFCGAACIQNSLKCFQSIIYNRWL